MDLKVFQNYQTVLEPQNSIDIFIKEIYVTQPQPPLNVTHSNVRPLSSNDFLFDSWNKSYIGQRTMWDDTKTWFFQITT
jgi:hypothetical protein